MDAEKVNATLAVMHEPDVSVETDERGHKYDVPLPGFLRIGVNVGDQFVEIARVKAGNIMDAIEGAKPKTRSTSSK